MGQPVTECRALLAAGIEHINALLEPLSAEPTGFWGTHLEACTALVAQATSETDIWYQAKLRQAREQFAKNTRRLSEEEITELVSSLSALPTAAPWPMAVPAECPARSGAAWPHEPTNSPSPTRPHSTSPASSSGPATDQRDRT